MTPMAKKTILLTGATGYIGSHTWCELIAAGFDVVGLDNLCNSTAAVVDRVKKITGTSPRFVEGDARDAALLDNLFARDKIDAAIHFAALKAVGDSVRDPLLYYNNNVNSMLVLADVMRRHAARTLVFSSSATVYGEPHRVQITEDFPLTPANPYGRTKLMCEQVLRDLEISDPAWRVGYLRYFNPVGAHPSGLIGEDPSGVPNNLMPYIAQVAIGKRANLQVFGADYPTADGTGVRDYIHVMDLAQGHVVALEHLFGQAPSFTVNLGTGQGYSVFDVIKAYERACGKRIPYQVVARRPGDVPAYYADPALAASLLGWRTKLDLDAMCADSWRWQQMNPEGYAE
jgi:UDP-glucose 4-epimerase